MVCIICISYRSIIGIDNLGKISDSIVLITDDFSVGIGVDCIKNRIGNKNPSPMRKN